MNTLPERLKSQIAFILELDQLKSVQRRSILSHENRRENSAEHSWHVALMSMLLCELADEPVDASKVMLMLLIHDIVEIDAGDAYIYDEAANQGKYERELAAAQRIFGLLPPDQAGHYLSLWEEFELKATPEARFAASCDRFIPLLHNHASQGQSWKEHGISHAQVVKVNQPIQEGSTQLWEAAQCLIGEALKKGFLAKE
jgi:putative hydrolase of HD superfamily